MCRSGFFLLCGLSAPWRFGSTRCVGFSFPSRYDGFIRLCVMSSIRSLVDAFFGALRILVLILYPPSRSYVTWAAAHDDAGAAAVVVAPAATHSADSTASSVRRWPHAVAIAERASPLDDPAAVATRSTPRSARSSSTSSLRASPSASSAGAVDRQDCLYCERRIGCQARGIAGSNRIDPCT